MITETNEKRLLNHITVALCTKLFEKKNLANKKNYKIFKSGAYWYE